MGFVGEKFTWEKTRGVQNCIQERLDRGLATPNWCDLFPEAEVKVIEVATSDHLPLLLQLNKKVYMEKRRRFRFENVWIKEQDCFNLVKNSWEANAGRDILEKMNLVY